MKNSIHDLTYTSVNQIWKLLSGILLLFLVPIYLTPEMQGYWYAFIGLAAFIFFADMGFSTISLQFAAHEFAHLKILNDQIVGEQLHIDRLATLWKFCIKFSTRMSVAVFPLVTLSGYLILSNKHTMVNWLLPWLIYCTASVLLFVNSMILSFVEGCDSVGDIQKIRFQISVITVTTTIILLAANVGIYALALSMMIGAIGGTTILFYRYKVTLNQLNKCAMNSSHNWWNEAKPLLWRYAASWISGYFIFAAFTPIAFHYFGAIEAGKVGFSISLCTAIFSISSIWITVIVPRINMLIAKSKYKELNITFKKNFVFSVFTFVLCAATLTALLYWLRTDSLLVGRLVSPIALISIMLGWFFQLIISLLAIFIRAHKIEPLMTYSVVSAIYITVTTLLCAILLPVEFYFVGFLSSYLFAVPWVMVIFVKNVKRGWA